MSGAVKSVVNPVAKVLGAGGGGGGAMPAPVTAAPAAVAAAPAPGGSSATRKDQLRAGGNAESISGFNIFTEEDAPVLGQTKKRAASRSLLG